MNRSSNFIFAILTGEHNTRSPYIRALLRTAQAMDVTAYSVTPRQLLMDRKNVSPDVVYNRIPTRKEESAEETKLAKQWLREQGIPYFNQRFFNKREMDQILRTDDELTSFLPNTLTLWEPNTVLRWLEQYEGVFIKPIGGSFGEGICRATKINGHYQLETRDGSGLHALTFMRPEDCVEACRTRMGNMPFIVQEAIPLAKYEGCKTDFRVHIHRLTDHEWKVAGIGAKVGHPEGITTHVHSGGRVEDGEFVLRSWYGDRVDAVRNEIEQTASLISKKLSSGLDVSLGELGLDMGIATDGRMVLFEANAKPGRSIFSHPSLRSAGQWSRKAILLYARWLVMHQSMAGVLR